MAPDIWVCRERTSHANLPWNYYRRLPTYLCDHNPSTSQTDRQTDKTSSQD